METVFEFFRHVPLLAVFLTLGLGFWLGKVRFGSFSLGAVAATLIVGVLFGQMKIQIPDMVKTVFFLLFLFSIGYSVGPQFVRSFRGSGLRMMGFALTVAIICSGIVLAASWIMGYDQGIATGLYAGSQTASACLGMIGDTVREMPVDETRRQYLLDIIPACYAVTYIFGTVGSAWFLSAIGPKLLGGLPKVLEETGAIEERMESGEVNLQPGQIRAGRPVIFRVYRVVGNFISLPSTVADFEKKCQDKGYTVYIERIRSGEKILNPKPDIKLNVGDVVVIGGRAESVVAMQAVLGPEVSDPELLNFGAEKTPVTVSSHGADGKTLGELRESPKMDGVMIASIKRNGQSLPIKRNLELHAGDVVTLVGWPRDVASAASIIGYADRQTDSTDMVFLGLGIALGCFVGALSIKIGGIPMSLGASVGALLSGLLLGWLRGQHPTFGHIPSSALWVMNNLGINMFIAVIGITAGAHFIHGIQEAGWWIFLVGAVCTLLGLTITILLGHKVFKLSRPETLGCVAGARCAVAAMGAVQQRLQSDVPNLGYTVTYAVANVTLVFASLLVLFLA